jgi:hypothetical protein
MVIPFRVPPKGPQTRTRSDEEWVSGGCRRSGSVSEGVTGVSCDVTWERVVTRMFLQGLEATRVQMGKETFRYWTRRPGHQREESGLEIWVTYGQEVGVWGQVSVHGKPLGETCCYPSQWAPKCKAACSATWEVSQRSFTTGMAIHRYPRLPEDDLSQIRVQVRDWKQGRQNWRVRESADGIGNTTGRYMNTLTGHAKGLSWVDKLCKHWWPRRHAT